MDKSRLNTFVYKTTHDRLKRLSQVTGKPMITLLDEAIHDLEGKYLFPPQQTT